MNPLVEMSLHIPDWPEPAQEGFGRRTYRTTTVKNNGFNPVWEESVSIPFTCVGDMWDLVFVQFSVMDEADNGQPLALYCTSLGSLRQGMYRAKRFKG